MYKCIQLDAWMIDEDLLLQRGHHPLICLYSECLLGILHTNFLFCIIIFIFFCKNMFVPARASSVQEGLLKWIGKISEPMTERQVNTVPIS